MGDRYYSYLDCPKCGSEYELYDAPSSLLYSGVCGRCGWSEPREYYETDEHTLELMTPEEYQSWEKNTGKRALNVMSEAEFDYWHKTKDQTIKNLPTPPIKGKE